MTLNSHVNTMQFGSSLVAQWWKNLPAGVGEVNSIHGSGRYPGEGNGNPL